MNQLILKSRQPEPSIILIDTPVKEREKIHAELFSGQNICAIDILGLSWIFAENDDTIDSKTIPSISKNMRRDKHLKFNPELLETFK